MITNVTAGFIEKGAWPGSAMNPVLSPFSHPCYNAVQRWGLPFALCIWLQAILIICNVLRWIAIIYNQLQSTTNCVLVCVSACNWLQSNVINCNGMRSIVATFNQTRLSVYTGSRSDAAMGRPSFAIN
jgi:hypothetical protein